MSLQTLSKDILIQLILTIERETANTFTMEIQNLKRKLDAWERFYGDCVVPCQFGGTCKEYVHYEHSACNACYTLRCDIHFHKRKDNQYLCDSCANIHDEWAKLKNKNISIVNGNDSTS